MTRIIECKCNHEYQDKLYGKGKRVHNGAAPTVINGKRKDTKFVCTVCLSVKEV